MLKTRKPEDVEKIKQLAEGSPVIGVLDMHKMPARAMQQIRNELDATIRMSRKTLMVRGLKKAGVERLSEYMRGSPALLSSDKNPFKLYATIKESKMPAPAKPGDIATKDISISKGPTPLSPGPAISQLQKIGLKTSVQEGKIHVTHDKVVCKKGEEIGTDLANVLGSLKIEPMEIGLDLVAALEKGVIYTKGVLDIDKEQYMKDVETAAWSAINLSLNIGYLTGENAGMALQKAFSEARELCVYANLMDSAFIEYLISKAVAEASVLESRTG